MTIFDSIKQILKKENSNSKVNKIQIKYWKILEQLIANQEIFEFNKDNINKISKTSDFIKEIYLNLFFYLLYWEFQNHDINLFSEKIDETIEKFNNENTWLKENNDFKLFIYDLKTIISDINDIKDFKLKINTKRKYILSTYNFSDSINSKWNNNKCIERKLLNFLLHLNIIQFYLEWDSNHEKIKNFSSILISQYEHISNIKEDIEDKKDNIKFLKDLIILNLYKISLYTHKNKFHYYSDWKIWDIKIESEMKKTCFKDYENILRFVSWLKVNNISFVENIKDKFLKEDFNLNKIEIYILTKYYKDHDKSKENLKKLYNNYRKKVFIEIEKIEWDEKMKNYLNLIFIWNNYFSFLIEDFKKAPNELLVKEIDDFYIELLNISKYISENNYKNYFTYYKYSYFKNEEYHAFFNILDFPYKKLKWIVTTWLKAWEKSEEILKSLTHHSFYDYDSEDYLLNTSIKWKYPIYVHNIFLFPFDNEKAEKNINNELNRAKENLLDIKYKEKFWSIEEKIENNKLEAMVIIWIFTWIVVYSIGTVQIFTLIEDLWSAILFSWIFLSWMLFLIWGIFFKSYRDIKNEIKYNKWFQLFIIAFFILGLSFTWKYYLSWDKLNINKSQNIYNNLDIKINQAEYIKDYLDNQIKTLEKLNKEIRENIK